MDIFKKTVKRWLSERATTSNRQAILLEAKWTDSEAKLEKACDEALAQIAEKQYAKALERSGFQRVIVLVIAFWQKKCLVKSLPSGTP